MARTSNRYQPPSEKSDSLTARITTPADGGSKDATYSGIEGARPEPGRVRGLNRFPLIAELPRYREWLGPTLASTVVPFALVFYLALDGGGYDSVVRSGVAVAVWWIVLLGAIVGVFPMRPLGRTELVVVGFLLAFAAWTALGISWSESSERSMGEVSRLLAFLGVLSLSLSAQDREALRRTVWAVGAAIGLVAALALLSRLQPSLIPSEDAGAIAAEGSARLIYPLNSWNGLAALIALGVPLVLAIAVESRRLLTQALATAALPAMALAAYYTLSRGGALELAGTLAVFLALHPRRLELLPTLGLGAAGAALAIAASSQRDALEDNLGNELAARQGDEMLVVVLVVCAVVALLRAALGLAIRHGRWPPATISVPPRTVAVIGGGLAVLALAVGLAASAPEAASQAWEDFKRPASPEGTTAQRFESASGNGRYQYWSAALDAMETAPLTGIGPGTYEFWWAAHGSITGFVRNAHSLYFEVLAELGIPGLALLLALLGGVFAVGFAGWRRAEGHERALLAAALAAMTAFALAASIDWVWQLTVLPVAFLLLTAAVLRASGDGSAPTTAQGLKGRRTRQRVALALLAVSSLVAIGLPMMATLEVRRSQDDVRAGRLDSALDAARSAERFEPFAATPTLQRALVLEAQNDLGAAAEAARDATRKESTNWRTWLTLSRIEKRRGRPRAAADAYGEARSLDPRSPLFVGGS